MALPTNSSLIVDIETIYNDNTYWTAVNPVVPKNVGAFNTTNNTLKMGTGSLRYTEILETVPVMGIFNPNASEAVRQSLTEHKTLYIDANVTTALGVQDGLTPISAFKTLKQAITFITMKLDLGVFDVVVNVASGTYKEETIILGNYMTSGGHVIIRGVTTDTTIFELDTPDILFNCIDATTPYQFEHVTLRDANNTTTTAHTFFKMSNSSITLNDVKFIKVGSGTCTGIKATNSSIEMTDGGFSGPITYGVILSNGTSFTVFGIVTTAITAPADSLLNAGINSSITIEGIIAGTNAGRKYTMDSGAVLIGVCALPGTTGVNYDNSAYISAGIS